MKFVRWLYLKATLNLLPMIAAVIAAVFLQPKGLHYVLIALFILLFALGRLRKAVDIFQCVSTLKRLNLVERAAAEEPTPEYRGYAITHSFVWGFDKEVCIPLQEITGLKPTLVRCVNNGAKNRALLKVTTKQGLPIYLLYHNGFASERDFDDVQNCVRDLQKVLLK